MFMHICIDYHRIHRLVTHQPMLSVFWKVLDSNREEPKGGTGVVSGMLGHIMY